MFSERFFHHVKFKACLSLKEINEEMLTKYIDLFYKTTILYVIFVRLYPSAHSNKYTHLVLKGDKDMKNNIKINKPPIETTFIHKGIFSLRFTNMEI